jgi:hypothetical protein
MLWGLLLVACCCCCCLLFLAQQPGADGNASWLRGLLPPPTATVFGYLGLVVNERK